MRDTCKRINISVKSSTSRFEGQLLDDEIAMDRSVTLQSVCSFISEKRFSSFSLRRYVHPGFPLLLVGVDGRMVHIQARRRHVTPTPSPHNHPKRKSRGVSVHQKERAKTHPSYPFEERGACASRLAHGRTSPFPSFAVRSSNTMTNEIQTKHDENVHVEERSKGEN